MPDEIKEARIVGQTLVKALTVSGMAQSGNEAYRLVDQGGVKVSGEVVKDHKRVLHQGDILQVGKRKFIKAKK